MPLETPSLLNLTPPQLSILAVQIRAAEESLLNITFEGTSDQVEYQLRNHAYQKGRHQAFRDLWDYDKEVLEQAQHDNANQG